MRIILAGRGKKCPEWESSAAGWGRQPQSVRDAGRANRRVAVVGTPPPEHHRWAGPADSGGGVPTPATRRGSMNLPSRKRLPHKTERRVRSALANCRSSARSFILNSDDPRASGSFRDSTGPDPEIRRWVRSGKVLRDPWGCSTWPRPPGRCRSVRLGPGVAAFCPHRLPLGSIWKIASSLLRFAKPARRRRRCLWRANCQRALWGTPRASIPESRLVWFTTYRAETATV